MPAAPLTPIAKATGIPIAIRTIIPIRGIAMISWSGISFVPFLVRTLRLKEGVRILTQATRSSSCAPACPFFAPPKKTWAILRHSRPQPIGTMR